MAVFNVFRIVADLMHLVSHIILLEKIWRHKNCAGVSLKTQQIYAIVFLSRYLDLFTNKFSVYNTVMKIIFIASTLYTIYLITKKFRATYDESNDNFVIWYLVVPALVIGVLFARVRTVTEILWSFSIVLESVAIIPQIYLLQRTGEVENLTADYIFCLGSYRALYILNWVTRVITEPGYTAWLVWLFGLVQTALYCDFFYFYIRSRIQGKKLVLPN